VIIRSSPLIHWLISNVGILSVGKYFKINEADRKKLEDWDGKEELPLPTMIKDSEGANPNDSTEPNDTIQQIYNEVAQDLNKLIVDPVDQFTLSKLHAMNEKIKTQNGKDGVSPAEQWTVDIGHLGSYFNEAKPFYDRLLKDEHDEEAKQALENIRAKMAKSYPDSFFVPIPTPEIRAKAAAEAKKNEEEAKNKADDEAKKKAAEEAKNKADEEAKKKAAEEAKKMAANEYPWKTLDTTDGRRIMAGRQHTRRGESQDKSTLIVASDLSDDPIYETTTGSNVGALEVEEFFNLDGIKLLAEKDEMGRDTQTWTWRDEDDFEEFLWCTKGTRNMHTFGKGSKAPATYCGVRFKKRGINVLTKTNLENVIKKKKAKNFIEEYCRRKGIPPPWEVEAENEKVPKDKKILAAQTWLAEQGIGNFAAASVAATTTPAAASATGNSALKSLEDKLAAMEKKIEGLQSPNAGGNSALKSLEDKLTAMERKIEGLQSPNTGSLDSILKKLEQMETKMADIDKISSSTERLGNVVSLLVEKVGLNVSK
jgi:hypothetical protein